MKKILFTIVSLLLLFVIPSPQPAFARPGNSCCTWPYSASDKGCSVFISITLPILCDPANEYCDLNNQVCLVNETTLADFSKDPTCPQGYNQPTICANSGVCCKADGFGCAGQSGIPLSCDDARKMWTAELPRNYCGNYGVRYKFDSTTGRCIIFSPTIWSISNTTCQGVAGYDTAIGCVPTGDLKYFLTFILKYVFFASGGIILLLIISTGYTIITSSGNPEKLQGAQENIVALFSGLALIAFSLVLLQAIGADILNLSAFK